MAERLDERPLGARRGRAGGAADVDDPRPGVDALHERLCEPVRRRSHEREVRAPALEDRLEDERAAGTESGRRRSAAREEDARDERSVGAGSAVRAGADGLDATPRHDVGACEIRHVQRHGTVDQSDDDLPAAGRPPRQGTESKSVEPAAARVRGVAAG